MAFKHRLVFLQIMLLLLEPVTSSYNISCSAGKTTVGGHANITCKFNTDIKSTKTNFSIWKFPINTADLNSSSYRTDVLNCNWIQNKPNCVTANGYKFKGLTRTFTKAIVDIPSATTDQEGIYECRLQTTEDIPTSTCNLTVEDRGVNQVIRDIENIISVLTPLGAFILIVVLVFIITIIICFVTIFYRCRYMRRRNVDHAVQTVVVSVADRGSNTYKQDCVDFGTDTSEFHGQQPDSKSPKGKSSGWFSRKEDKGSLVPKQQNGVSFDNCGFTANEEKSSLSKSPGKSSLSKSPGKSSLSKSPGKSSISSTYDDEEQQHQLLQQIEGGSPATHLQSSSPLGRESPKEGAMDCASGYDYKCPSQMYDPDTTQYDIGKGSEKEKKGLIKKVFSQLKKK